MIATPAHSPAFWIKAAKSKNMRSFELRAVVSLARLFQERGKREQARSMLKEVYDRFQEGHNTKELLDAKRILDIIFTT